jgi:hypothetical protein
MSGVDAVNVVGRQIFTAVYVQIGDYEATS